MTQKLDYSREEAMQILNNENYSDEEKRKLYDTYMNELKKNRKTAIINKLNEYAKDIPVITKEIYISKLKEYESDDLSKPFEVIESELSVFGNDMKTKYNEYLESQKPKEDTVEEMPVENTLEEVEDDEKFDDTIFSDPITDFSEEEEEVKPSLLITNEMSVINEEPEEDLKPLFETASEDAKEIIPEYEKEKGSASAIIISIIAVIIGIVVMYTIIKLN